MKKSWGVFGFAFLALIVLSVFSHSVFAYDAYGNPTTNDEAIASGYSGGLADWSANAIPNGGGSSSSGVSVITSSVSNVINQIVSAVSPVVSTVLGTTNTGEDLLAKFGFFLIMLGILYAVTNKIPLLQEEGWVQWVIVIVISVLSVRFFTETAWIRAALLPSTALLVAIISILPLAIYFYLINTQIFVNSRIMRVIAWVVAAVAFVGLFVTRFDELGSAAGGSKFNPAWIYAISAVACVVIFLIDKTIQHAVSKVRQEGMNEIFNIKTKGELRTEMRDIYEKFKASAITQTEFDALKAAFNTKAKALGFPEIKMD